MTHGRTTPSAPPQYDPGAAREELHWRRIDMRGYRRGDGLFEVEGRVTDRKTSDLVPLVGDRVVPAHQPVHDMGVRIVFDEQMVVHAVTTFTDAAPYDICPLGGLALQSLKGLRMTSGWGKEVRSRLRGARSCTHLMELLAPLATVAFQSLSALRKGQPLQLDANGRPAKIDSCYAYGAERDLVRQYWPEHYRAPRGDETHDAG
jgi:hypothetical protein